MRLEVITPHGFCAGVTAAVAKAEKALASSKDVVYCLHELVHNEKVVDDLRRKGMVFVDAVREIPRGGTVLFSAHGVAPSVREMAAARQLKVIDATCPFVERLHKEVRKYSESRTPVIIVGDGKHAETIGIAGEMEDPSLVEVVSSPEELLFVRHDPFEKVGVVCQTTMNCDKLDTIVSALKSIFFKARTTKAANVCNATRERQSAVADFVAKYTASGLTTGVLVLGSERSSNTKRLVEIAEKAGAKWTRRVGDERALAAVTVPDVDVLGITAGASTPEDFLEKTVSYLGGER